jgi:hypothetical protein
MYSALISFLVSSAGAHTARQQCVVGIGVQVKAWGNGATGVDS